VNTAGESVGPQQPTLVTSAKFALGLFVKILSVWKLQLSVVDKDIYV
jgi:hypothetical protein